MSTGTLPADETPGIWAEIRVEASDCCPVARASACTDGIVQSVARSVPDETNSVVEEFTIGSTADLDRPEFTTIYRTDDETTYRFTRSRERQCLCESVEQFGLPVSDVRARQGELILSIYVTEVETVKEIIAALRDTFGGVYLHRLDRTTERVGRDAVEVDRSELTDRQREVLETAFEMGYFSYPKRANANQVADELDVCPSTFTEHLSAALTKLLESILSE